MFGIDQLDQIPSFWAPEHLRGLGTRDGSAEAKRMSLAPGILSVDGKGLFWDEAQSWARGVYKPLDVGGAG